MYNSKYKNLLTVLRSYRRVGIAFSGGVDSTLLLYAAMEALGEKNVIALNIRSTLNAQITVQNTAKVFKDNFPIGCVYKEITATPLSWPDFVRNDDKRCYFCKKKMYETLWAVLDEENMSVLADGTNADDLLEDRPGLLAVKELSVVTPLVEAGLTKKEIRTLAKEKGLTNFALPSNSCLATRLQKDTEITEEKLKLVEQIEQYLHELGYQGCRVRPSIHFTVIEVQEKDIECIILKANRSQVFNYVNELGIGPAVLNMRGR